MAKSPTSNTKLKILGDKSCPSCVSRGRDSKGNHLILFENEKGDHFGKCNRCGHYESDKSNLQFEPRRERTPEELAEELQECSGLPTRALTSRRISGSVAERFGVRVGFSEADGQTITEHYYPRTREKQTVAFNVRSLDPKGFYYRGSPRGGTEPFGWEQVTRGDVSRKKLFIAEDELSAMSIYQVLELRTQEKYRHIKPAVISWSAGVGSATRDLANLQNFLKNFQEVVYVHDNDDAGLESVEVVRSLLPSCKFVTTPDGFKDANDLLMANKGDELFSLLIYQSKVKSPDCAIRARDALELALKPPEWGLSYPWEGVTNLSYGQRFGEIRSWGAGTGLGKTLIAHQIVGHNIIEHNLKCAVALLEENNGDSLKNIAGKIAQVPFHRPDIPFDKDRFMDAYSKIENNLFLWSNRGANDFQRILEAFRFWAVVEGVKHFTLDNVTCLVSHLEMTQQNVEINRIAMECAGLADELGVVIDIFSHLNPPGGSKSHEGGAEVRENQFTGSRALQRWSHFMYGFERNKQAEGDEKHLSRIRLLKNRPYGLTGVVHTKYDLETGCLVETEAHEVPTTPTGDDEPFV